MISGISMSLSRRKDCCVEPRCVRCVAVEMPHWGRSLKWAAAAKSSGGYLSLWLINQLGILDLDV